MMSNIYVGMSTTDIYLHYGKFIVICKPGLWMTVGEDSVQYWKRKKREKKKHCFLVAAILFFIGKIIIT